VHVLILDDQLKLFAPLRRLASLRGWETHFVGSLLELEQSMHIYRQVAFVLVNLQSSLTAWELEQWLRRFELRAPMIVLREIDSKDGASDMSGAVWMDRPLGEAELLAELEQRVNRFELGSELTGRNGIIGQSKSLHEVLARIEKAAPGHANLCISGESGTGKDLIARAIHALSTRADRPLVTLDCTAIPEGLMESHLFGHVRGSFTGAVESRTGFFALANTGTLFIDEISELSLPLQAKLLRAIQTREFVKVGDSKPTRTDIRLITASNRDLRRAVRKGTFREDLYYRIAVVMVEMPSLRERREDIPLLVEHFLRKFSVAHHKSVPRILPRALELLEAYDWPGNVRQLENCIEQAVVLGEDDTVDVSALLLGDSVHDQPSEEPTGLPPGLSLRDLEHQYIVQTLENFDGNRTRAAGSLGISLRSLQYKLKEYGYGSLKRPARTRRGPASHHLVSA
jgi:transcriptional regulator with PAS, ATPase and Fis domain